MNPLISSHQLNDLVGRPHAVTVLDVRYRPGRPGHHEHAAGHVPGSTYVDLDSDLASAPGNRPGTGGRHPLPSAADFATAMRRCGVHDDRPVVVYDDWSARAASRCWWLLRNHGHQNVRVLDGGWSAWLEDGLPVERTSLARPTGDFVPQPGDLTAIGADEVPGVEVLIDARAAERYRGEVEPLDATAGHIPGAVNVPTTSNLADHGRFRPVDELRSLYAAVGAVPGADVAVYCGSGVTATHDILALEVAGVRARLYAASWSGWITDPDRPVERAMPRTTGRLTRGVRP